MSEKTKDFLRKFKLIFLDIVLLYKNFLHWNISKSIIGIYTMLLGLLFSLPFLIILLIAFLLDPIPWLDIFWNIFSWSWQSASDEVLMQLLMHPFYAIFESILVLAAIVWFIIGSSYSTVLKVNLYMSYINWKQIKYLKNIYFSKDVMSKYIKIFVQILWFISIPITLYLVLFIIIFSKFIEGDINSNTYNDIIFWLNIIAACIFLYFSYRVYFFFMVLLDKNDNIALEAKKILPQSLKITRWLSIVPFVMVITIFGILFLPFNIIEESIDSKANNARLYLSYKSGQNPLDSEDKKLDFLMLEKLYIWNTDSEVINEITVASRIKILYVIFAFLCIEWVFTMILLSFYQHFLLQETEKKSLLWKLKKALLGGGKKKV